MKEKMRYSLLLVALLLSAAAVFAGCGKKEKVTAESLMEEVSANMKDVDSAHMKLLAEISMGIKQSGISMDMDIDLDMDMEVVNDPSTAHVTADMSMSLMGISMQMENYSVEEDGKMVVYNGMGGEWTRTEQPLDKEKAQSMNDMISEGTSYELQDKKEKLDGREVYVLNGKVSGKYLEGMMGEVSDGMGSIPMDWSKMEFNMVIKIDAKTKVPVEAEIDCGDAMAELMEGAMGAAGAGDVEVSIKEFVMTCIYESFNDVDEIVVPEDVKAKAVDIGGASNESSDSLEDFLNNSQKESDLPTGPTGAVGAANESVAPNEDGTYTLMDFWGGDGSVSIAVPSGYVLSSSSESTYLAFDDTLGRTADDVYVSYMLDHDYTEDEMEEYYMEDVEYYTEENGYTNLDVQEKQTVQVNGREVSYIRFAYGYSEVGNYVEYHAWTFLPDGQVIQCDVAESSYDGECDILDDSIVETVMAAIQE